LLSQNPAVERALRQELSSVLGTRLPNGSDIDQLDLASRIIKESMRLYPPAYALARRAVRDTTIGPYKVPRRSEVVIWIYFTHRDSRYYPQPEQFRPDRFLPDDEAARPRQAYLPFGLGARACIGRSFAQVEATILLASLLQRFTFRYTAKTPPRMRARITLTPAGGLVLVPHAVAPA
jgi:cytochrome P450